MNRRGFLRLGAAGFGGLGLGACSVSLEDGLWNPCLDARLPDALARDPLVRAAWEGIDALRFRDFHVHVAGVGDGGTGIWISPQTNSLLHPWQSFQRRIYLNAACADRDGVVDALFAERLLQLMQAFPPGAKAMLLAFDFHHDATGRRREDLSAFHVPDRHAAALARAHPARLEWICSIHPFRRDAREALEWAAAQGARAVKWLPSAMGIDPADARCDPFYDAAARRGLPLLSHTGAEAAVHNHADPQWNNPLRLRRALERGVRVVVAHCGSAGRYDDIDARARGVTRDAFELFTRLMGERRYEGRLFGEISAVVQANRMGAPLKTLVTRTEWHPRLVNGSDYPLPGVYPLYSLSRLVGEGWIGEPEAEVLRRVRRHNPMLFDFVLKRSLRWQGARFAPSVFESDHVFVRPAVATPTRS